MTTLLYDDAIRALRENDVPILGTTGASEENIRQIEARLDVRLPPSYRKMLSDFGALEFGTTELYGWLSQGLDVKFATNVVYTTERERADGRISKTMVPFLTSGYGPFYVIDCVEVGLNGEAAIYEISPAGYERGKDRLADSFGAFLVEEVNRSLQARDDGDDFEEDAASPSPQRTGQYWKERAKDFE